jgi:hypothetical protein
MLSRKRVSKDFLAGALTPGIAESFYCGLQPPALPVTPPTSARQRLEHPLHIELEALDSGGTGAGRKLRKSQSLYLPSALTE